ncbi:MAG: hypothetical protein JXJ04_09420 [Spirochaetales bacterium]|nr:hypothetical protein [Spirochaetales bacterium]
MPLENIKVNLKLGIFDISGTWQPDAVQRKAAWELYVELVTRISFAKLKKDEGILREALSSLHKIFEITRTILKKYGPKVARPKGKSKLSFGYTAVGVLNLVLGPVLARWHPLLSAYEKLRKDTVSVYEHEQKWDKNEELRQALNDVREKLIEYIVILAKAAKVETMFEKIVGMDSGEKSDIGI